MLEVNLTGVEQSGSWWWLAVSAPHSGTTLDLLHTCGTAAAVVGVCLLLTRARPNLLLPLSAAGAMTLTLYSMHIWVMALVDAQEPAAGSVLGVLAAGSGRRADRDRLLQARLPRSAGDGGVGSLAAGAGRQADRRTALTGGAGLLHYQRG